MTATYLGIDLTASAKRPSGVALLSEGLEVLHAGTLRRDADLLTLVAGAQPLLVSIDCPLGLPLGWDCLDLECSCGQCDCPTEDRRRRCEVELAARRIPCYWTTRRSIIREMVYRGMELRYHLEKRRVQVLEVYPYGTKVHLWGRGMPPKTRPEGLAWLRARMAQLLPSLGQRVESLTHDEADALLAAYTAWLHARGRTETLGLKEEGQIVLPLGVPVDRASDHG